jgi:hypothetical protein
MGAGQRRGLGALGASSSRGGASGLCAPTGLQPRARGALGGWRAPRWLSTEPQEGEDDPSEAKQRRHEERRTNNGRVTAQGKRSYSWARPVDWTSLEALAF